MGQLLLVDQKDQIIGYGEKQAVHDEGLLHRAFSIFLYHEKTKKILVQRRARGKYHSGGLWSNTCCSHPYAGETPLESYRRCLMDELRDPLPECMVREVGSFCYFRCFQDNCEHEYDHVILFICKEPHVPVFNPNPLEIEDYRWNTAVEIREALEKAPQEFTAWFPQAFALALAGLNNIYLTKTWVLSAPPAQSLHNIFRPDTVRQCAANTAAFPHEQYYTAFSQGKTGYCWLTTALYGISRQIWQSQGGTQNPMLFSKDHLVFLDKLEKANHFLEKMIQMMDAPLDSLPASYFLGHPMRDQGHWNMAWSLIAKYGLFEYMPSCDLTLERSFGTLNGALGMILRLGAYELRTLYESTHQIQDVLEKKAEILEKVRQFLLDYWYSTTHTSIDFSNAFVCPVSDLWTNTICISCGYGTPGVCYEILYDGNLEEGSGNSFLELHHDQFQAAIHEEIQRFGFCLCCCDSNMFYDQHSGYCGDAAFDFSSYIDDSVYRSLTLEKRVAYHLSCMSHAIVLLEAPSRPGAAYFAFDPAAHATGGTCTLEQGWLRRYVSIALVHNDQLPPDTTPHTAVSVAPWIHFGM